MRRILLATLISLGFATIAQATDIVSPAYLTGMLSVTGKVFTSAPPISDALSSNPQAALSLKLCHGIPDNSIQGRAISAKVLEMKGFQCQFDIDEAGRVATPMMGVRLGCAEPYQVGYHACEHERVIMNVHLANPADAAKMQSGKIATLSADVHAVTVNNILYLIADNAKYLHGNPFGR